MTAGTRCPRTLGLLGGMGPAATVDVLDKIVRATPAACDQEHIPVLVRCVPQIPDRTQALLGRGPSPADALIQGAVALRRAGADVLAIACNTAHHWYRPIREASGLPVLHIADAVLHELHAGAVEGGVGILATSGTIASGFYRQYLETAGYAVVMPEPDSQRDQVEGAIARAKAGDWAAAGRLAQEAADTLFRRGAGQIVVACTELPMALGHRPGQRLLDANLALAHACVRATLPRHRKKMPERAA